MEEKEILYVETVAKYKSVTKAAEQLFISQPSLTQALHRIEKNYGASFFVRTHSGLELTDKGKIYLDAAGRMEEMYHQMEREIRIGNETHSGHINFGITAIQSGFILPTLCKKCREKFPRLELHVVENTSVNLEKMILDGRLDMALIHRPFDISKMEYVSIYREPLMLAVPADDQDWINASHNTREPVITSEMLARKKFIFVNGEQRVRQMADNICAIAGIVPKVEFETSSTITAVTMVGNGMGAAFVPKYIVNMYKEKLGFNVFSFPPAWNVKWEMVAAYKNNIVLPDIYRKLIRTVQETVASMPEIYE